MEAVNKRNFLLMVSPSEGQELSARAGFSKPSKEVQDAETLDVVTGWITLAASGSLKYVHQASEWVSEYIASTYGIDEDQIPLICSGYYAFGVGLLSHLINSGAVDLKIQGRATDNVAEFIKHIPTAFTVMIPEDDEFEEDTDDE